MQISTDYVFDGKSKTPYKYSHSTNPINIYGKSKEFGEEAIQKIRNKIFNRLLDRGLFDKFADIMGKLQNKFTDFMNSKGLDLIEEYVGKFNKYLNGFIDDLGKLKFNELVDKYIFAPIKAALFGKIKEEEQQKKERKVQVDYYHQLLMRSKDLANTLL